MKAAIYARYSSDNRRGNFISYLGERRKRNWLQVKNVRRVLE